MGHVDWKCVTSGRNGSFVAEAANIVFVGGSAIQWRPAMREPRAQRAIGHHQGFGDDPAGGAAELDPPEMREFHRILIGDLLDMGLIESGTPSVAPEPSEVVVLLERARSTFVKGLGLAIR